MESKEVKLFKELGGQWGHVLAYNKQQLPQDKANWDNSIIWQGFDSQPAEFKQKVMKSIHENGYYRCAKEDYQYIWIPQEPSHELGSPKWIQEQWKFAVIIFAVSFIISFLTFRYHWIVSEFSSTIGMIFLVLAAITFPGMLFGGLIIFIIIVSVIVNGIKYSFKK